jgi:hypothetical protein
MSPVSAKDRQILRDLAYRVAEIAALPVQQETIRLWKGLNGLRPVRPMVMIDQIPWHEMDVDDELALQTEDEFCRRIETGLRRTLYSWKHMRADMVVQPVVHLPKAIRGAHFGLGVTQDTAVLDPRNDVVGHQYHDQLETEADLEKIRMPEVTHDEAATARTEETARGIFDGILAVRMQGFVPFFCPWDRITEWHTPQNALLDLAVRPEFMHQMMTRLTAAHLSMLDQLEAQDLLVGDQPTIHCTGAFSDELPATTGAVSEPIRAKDQWTAGMAQIFSTVSPAMHQEFDLAYAHAWYSRFGLVYYGCCEPLHTKIGIIRAIPHVRKISMSPWVVQEEGAEQIGRDFVFSRKPSPAFLAEDEWAPARVEKDLRTTLDTCARHGCPVELILKDISTVRYHPERLWDWERIAMRLAGAQGR